MIKVLKKMFEANSGKSTIQIKGKCSDCGREIIISITSTAEGFGLQGGALYKRSSDAYLAQCPECYKNNPKTKASTVGNRRDAVGGLRLEAKATPIKDRG